MADKIAAVSRHARALFDMIKQSQQAQLEAERQRAHYASPLHDSEAADEGGCMLDDAVCASYAAPQQQSIAFGGAAPKPSLRRKGASSMKKMAAPGGVFGRASREEAVGCCAAPMMIMEACSSMPPRPSCCPPPPMQGLQVMSFECKEKATGGGGAPDLVASSMQEKPATEGRGQGGGSGGGGLDEAGPETLDYTGVPAQLDKQFER